MVSLAHSLTHTYESDNIKVSLYIGARAASRLFVFLPKHKTNASSALEKREEKREAHDTNSFFL